MDDYRKKIENNRDLFDDKEPLDGHMQRFEDLLNKQEKQEKPTKRVSLIRVISTVAAIAVFVVVAVKFFAPQDIHVTSAPQIEQTINMSNEFLATNDYYKQQMEQQIEDIMCKMAHTDVENQKQLAADLEKIKERNAAFVREMENNENQEIAIRYLVKHYKTNIQALENINEKLGKHAKC